MRITLLSHGTNFRMTLRNARTREVRKTGMLVVHTLPVRGTHEQLKQESPPVPRISIDSREAQSDLGSLVEVKIPIPSCSCINSPVMLTAGEDDW